MKIAIGSKNPAKIAATRQAFGAAWPDEELEIVAMTVPSGVSDQPLTTDETIKGAVNRAKTVKVSLRPDFAVGIEAGLSKIGEKWFVDGWVAVIDSSGRVGLGGSPSMEAAPKVMKLIKSGHEMRLALDEALGQSDPPGNYFELMTSQLFSATDGFCDAIIMALSRFMRPDAFE